jgi:hypothetical protein
MTARRETKAGPQTKPQPITTRMDAKIQERILMTITTVFSTRTTIAAPVM